jgi:hypothetical protein
MGRAFLGDGGVVSAARRRRATASWAFVIGLSASQLGCGLVKVVLERLSGDDAAEAPSVQIPSSEPPAVTASAAEPSAPAPSSVSSAAPTTVPTAVPAAARNAADVERFDDEKALEPLEARIELEKASVRRAPKTDAPEVILLDQLWKVSKLAERQDYVLVSFDDPKAPGELLMGWVEAKALEPAEPGGASAPPAAIPAPKGTDKPKSAPKPDKDPAPSKSSPPAKSPPPGKSPPKSTAPAPKDPPADPAPNKKKKKKKVGEAL